MGVSGGGFLVLMLLVSISNAATVFQPISNSHISAALKLFTPANGSFGSLEDTYKALRTFSVLVIEKKPDVSTASCESVSRPLGSSSLILKEALEINGLLSKKENFEDTVSRLKAAVNMAYKGLKILEVFGLEMKPNATSASCQSLSKTLGSSSSILKDVFYGLKVNGILKCKINGEAFEDTISRLKVAVNNASSLIEYYYSVGSLALIKEQTSKADLHLTDPEGVFHSIKALSQSDGRWHYNSSNPESTAFAAGIALQTLAGVVSLSSSIIDQSMIGTLRNDIVKLFHGIEQCDDGAFYFDDKLEHQSSISTTSSVVRGLTALAAVSDGNLNLPGDKILGLAKFFLGIGIPADAEDFYNQIDSLACLESNRVSIPLILSLPSTMLSLTKDSLKVKVTTTLGSIAPPLTLKLVGAFRSNSKDTSLIDSQDLKLNPETGDYILNGLPESIDVGSYVFAFEIVIHESNHGKVYAAGSQTKVPIFVTGPVQIENAEISVLDSGLGNTKVQKKLDLSGKISFSLSANHLQMLRLSFQLTTPRGRAFQPHQAFLKLRHESKVEHIFVVGSSGKRFELVLDFLELVEKFFYLSGRYDIELILGDDVMENSLLRSLGHIELDLPEPPKEAPHPILQPVDPYSSYGPKAEIMHISSVAEKYQLDWIASFFTSNVAAPLSFFLGALIIQVFGVNLRNFPTEAGPAIYAVLFHVGIGAVLVLYVLFWFKLDLLTTLKILCLLGAFLVFVGHKILSHLAAKSSE